MSLPPAVMRRLMREITQLKTSPAEGIRVQTSDDNMLDLTGIIEGPEGTPYAGGYFKVKFNFTEEFPAAPPKCWFATKIFHPNVSSAGEICVNTLKKDWKATYGIEHILVTVKCLLIYPNPESALDEEAGKLLLEDYDSYCSRAKLITSVHATPRVRPTEFDTPAASSTDPESSSSATCSSSASPAPTPSTTTAPPGKPPASLSNPTATLSVPIITRKSASPAPPPPSQPQLHVLPLKSSPGSNLGENEGSLAVVGKDKDRHNSPSPAPLGTADANVALGLVPPAVPAATAPKAVTGKRAAAGGGASGAEKRKKALKRL
ncbi:ubiquitin-conjugating enzyme/RWD-like protein [Mycena pura]|uniref:E2 ubiquitin-conjugating enzyme n=1 Tax=Mycena pura TaxID=153505 RepID=A0AAD6XXH3_9AGAR|nr:ubiquitin-conjugating enzyme/RWD-like protein [Mycena pura]